MNSNSCKVFSLYFIAPIFKSYVAEAEEGVFSLVNMLRTVAHKSRLSLGTAKVGSIEIPLCVKHFGVADNSLFTLVALDFKLNIAGQVLTEIKNGFALGCNDDFLYSKAE